MFGLLGTSSRFASTRKRLFALLMAAMLLFSLLPTAAFATGADAEPENDIVMDESCETGEENIEHEDGGEITEPNGETV